MLWILACLILMGVYDVARLLTGQRMVLRVVRTPRMSLTRRPTVFALVTLKSLVEIVFSNRRGGMSGEADPEASGSEDPGLSLAR